VTIPIDVLPSVEEFPDPFAPASGDRIATPADWPERRRQIRDLLLFYEYGHLPPPPANLRSELLSSLSFPEGRAVEERVLLSCGPEDRVSISLSLLRPAQASRPCPVVLTGDLCWGPAPAAGEVVRRGYALAQFDRTEVAPDAPGRDTGVYPLYPGYDWGALAAWAWGYHRVVDYLTTRLDVDPNRIAVTGHSRGGKAALLAGALDDRIALTTPNDSGCGGAGSFRHQGPGSESLDTITTVFPYWFHPRLRDFVGREDRLPFDQHFLLALVAPRALLTTNALGDLWANPEGSQQTYLAAKQVFAFLGAGTRIGNHYREGGHEHNADDWNTLLDFADGQFQGRSVMGHFDGRPFSGRATAFSWTAPIPPNG